MIFVLVPAYGRDYKSKAEVIADWQANKDFQIQPSGQYMNRQQARGSVNIRYNKLRKVVVIDV